MHSAATVVASLVAGAGNDLGAGVYYFHAISAMKPVATFLGFMICLQQMVL